jgi:hypothetical protein
MVSARWAQTLLDAATPGPWRMDLCRERDAIHIDAPNGDGRIGHDAWEGLAIVYGCEDYRRAGDAAAHGNASLICAAHDLAQTVVALHAEVERLRHIADRYGAESSLFARKMEQAQKAHRLAASAERGRIVAWLRAWADAYEPKYSVYPDDCRDLADRIERGEVTP